MTRINEALTILVLAAKDLSEQFRREPLSSEAGQLAALQVVVAYDNLASGGEGAFDNRSEWEPSNG